MRLALALLLATPLVGAAPPPAASATPDARFTELGRDFLRDLAAAHPGHATYIGDHSHDGEVDDLSAGGRARDAAMIRRHQARLAAIPRATLAPENQVDAALLSHGYTEHLDLRRAVEAREGARYDAKRYHDAVLAHGSPPVRYLRALMLNERVAS